MTEDNSKKATGKTNRGSGNVKSPDKPLLIYYDCEAANGNLFQGDIIEIAARCDPDIIMASFEAMIHSTQDLGWFAISKCGIKKEDLLNQPSFSNIWSNFIRWIKNNVKKANRKTGSKHFPVLCAHGGFGFDFLILLGNMKRYNVNENVLKRTKLHFSDSFDHCKKLQDCDCKELVGVRLSMDSLFAEFCPDRHHAMGDVDAMIDIFFQPSLKVWMKQMRHITAEELCSLFHKQYSHKEQQLILEEKLVKLDAYSKCVNIKKLLQIQLTYEGIQRIFENCSSFMDFYECMKNFGIDRKTSKYLACQFGALGLRNQGTVPYCGFTNPDRSKDDDDNDDNLLEQGVDLRVDPSLLTKNEEFERPPNVPEVPANEFTITETSECWDTETDASRSFTIQLAKPATPLSVTIDEFVSPGKNSFQGSFNKNTGHNIYEGQLSISNYVSCTRNNEDKCKNRYQPPKQLLKNAIMDFPKTNRKIPKTYLKKNKDKKTEDKNSLEAYQQHLGANSENNTVARLDNSNNGNKELKKYKVLKKCLKETKNHGETGNKNMSKELDDCRVANSEKSCCLNKMPCQAEKYILEMVPGLNGTENSETYTMNDNENVISIKNGPKSCVNLGQVGTESSNFRNGCDTVSKNDVVDDSVVFVYNEQDITQKNWPRELFWIGDIPIYVPVEPSVAMQPKPAESCHLAADVVNYLESWDTSQVLRTGRRAFESCDDSANGTSGSEGNNSDFFNRDISLSSCLIKSDGGDPHPFQYDNPEIRQYCVQKGLSSPIMTSGYGRPFVSHPYFYPMEYIRRQQVNHRGIPPGYYPAQPNPRSSQIIPQVQPGLYFS